MVRSRDGRVISARKNGFSFVSLQEIGHSAQFGATEANQFLLDRNRAEQIAAGLEDAESCTLGTNNGRVLALTITEPVATEAGVRPRGLILGEQGHAPSTPGERPAGPWTLSLEQGTQLAAEIRKAVAG